VGARHVRLFLRVTEVSRHVVSMRCRFLYFHVVAAVRSQQLEGVTAGSLQAALNQFKCFGHVKRKQLCSSSIHPWSDGGMVSYDGSTHWFFTKAAKS
jgi:hypothetical protein